MAGAWSVASGMMLRDILKKGDLEKERLEYEKELEVVEKDYVTLSYSLGYLSSIDRAGFLRAMAKARQTFKALNPKDKYLGMVKYDEERDSYYLNVDFVYVVEDFYFEMKRGVSKEEYKRQKYEDVKQKFINAFENDPTAYVEYPKKKFGIDKKELFERIKEDKLICCFKVKEDTWFPIEIDEYREGVKKGEFVEIYPLFFS